MVAAEQGCGICGKDESGIEYISQARREPRSVRPDVSSPPPSRLLFFFFSLLFLRLSIPLCTFAFFSFSHSFLEEDIYQSCQFLQVREMHRSLWLIRSCVLYTLFLFVRVLLDFHLTCSFFIIQITLQGFTFWFFFFSVIWICKMSWDLFIQTLMI